MTEITRELIEHYLRATGWIQRPSPMGVVWHDSARGHTNDFPASWAFTVDADLARCVTGHSEGLAGLAFRLGICAAAENDLLWATAWEIEAIEHRPDDEIDKRGVALLRSMARRNLESIGISLAAWESARLPTIESGAKAGE